MNVLVLGGWVTGMINKRHQPLLLPPFPIFQFSFIFFCLVLFKRINGFFWFSNVAFSFMGFYRCNHYRRRCRIRAPCCNEIYPCRHCHNDATVNMFFLNLKNFLVHFFFPLPFNCVVAKFCIFDLLFRACWEIPMIGTSWFGPMLNKYDSYLCL